MMSREFGPAAQVKMPPQAGTFKQAQRVATEAEQTSFGALE
jgi:hypothetical protein